MRKVLLLELGAPDLPALVPVAQVFGAWAPAVYQFPDVPVPAGFTVTALADAVLLVWGEVPRAEYVIERAPDVAGAPGTWKEVERTTALSKGMSLAPGTTYWWRIKAIVFGRSSAYSAQIQRAPVDMDAALANLDMELGIVNDALADASADAAEALIRLDDIDDDGILSPVEKPSVIQDYEVITAEQAGIDSEADAYRITTEKATYDAAVAALTAHLATLTAPVAWNDSSGDTAISRTTFSAKFKAVYDAKIALLNEITAILKIRVDLAKGPNLACNYTFYDTGRWINELSTTDGISPYGTNSYLRLAQTAGNNPGGGDCNFTEDNTFEVGAGDVVFVSVRGWNTYSTHASRFAIRWGDAAGGLISVDTVAEWSAGQGPATVAKTLTAPAGAATGNLRAYILGAATGDEFRIANIFAERNNLLKSGSGAQLGGARNQAMVTTGNVAAWWKNLSFSWSTTSTSASISCSAATLVMGNDSIPYSASGPVVVTGSPGTTKKVYAYRVDPDYSGGAKSMVLSTSYEDTVNDNGKLWMAALSITFPSSGTGTGSRGGADCVHEMAWVVRRGAAGRPERVRAWQVVAGRDWLLQTDGTWRLVTIADRCWAPIVRARFACGHSLTCSRSGPLELADGGGYIDALDALGASVTYQHQGNASDVVAVEDRGFGWVMHFYMDDGCFLAGDDPDHLFGHHNIKNNVP